MPAGRALPRATSRVRTSWQSGSCLLVVHYIWYGIVVATTSIYHAPAILRIVSYRIMMMSPANAST